MWNYIRYFIGAISFYLVMRLSVLPAEECIPYAIVLMIVLLIIHGSIPKIDRSKK